MRTKLLDPYMPIVKLQDQQFPDDNYLSFDRHLTGILQASNGNWCFNFKFSDGTDAKLTTDGHDMKEVKMEPAGRAVKRVVVWYYQSEARLVGLRLFD